ncbi:uncharacterized protein TRAVEDRAFT_48879 [Trametes versicolor FP-101664 SS1]|uniref:uncharacterized protein n=1 Tax=Trametes versicolor (strain FP-101664) TaxID=717944 RepID=UPI00046249F4|nr:uncharacterized protein TRAVEDRAFT_48879 [Trametes versicolor FP-101664 SS1]EIW57852.1 hypothetical protein TRAVEDRAFT_48879 [Trametes versicolor FP-101664 SS1]
MPTPANATSADPPADPSLPMFPALDNTFGAVLLGTFIGLIIYGLTLHQSYRYVRLYPNDSRALKRLVALVVFLETVTSVLSMHVCYYYLTTHYFDPEALLAGVWSLNVRSLFPDDVVDLKASLQVVSLRIRCHYGNSPKWLVSTGSTMAVTADMLLTAALIVFLHRSRTGLKRTDTMIDTLIIYSVNTGLLTGILNLLSLLFAFFRPGDLIYIGFGIAGVRTYATTLLAALNSRQSLAAHGAGMSDDTNPFGFGNTAVLQVSCPRGGSQVHAPQQRRPSRIEEISAIELKVPSHFGDSVRLSAETANKIDFPHSGTSSQYYGCAAGESV